MSKQSSPSSTDLPRLTNLSLRDGQQSTLDGKDWILDTYKMAQVLRASALAGFSGAEVSGGQSFQTAISNGYNPFTIADALANAQRSSPQVAELDLQMLFRGANALGFRHYDKDVVEATLNEFIKNGVSKIRFFDALNDIDNLFIPESVKGHSGVILQAAMCFGHYAHAPDRYTDDYYVGYLQALMAKGFDSFAIKDMSGQMTPERIRALLPRLQTVLKPHGMPLELHLHSTNEVLSAKALAAALELGVDGIETVEGPLAGGSAHHRLADIVPHSLCHSTAFIQLEKVSRTVWGASPNRKDSDIPSHLRDKLCEAGVPGGAMPFVIRDLRTQAAVIEDKYFKQQRQKLASTQKFVIGKINQAHGERATEKLGFEVIVELFIAELKRVCFDAALPLLVTPTADICAKQAIANLAFGKNPYGETLEDRYLNANGDTGADPRFCKLVLGYYGEFKSYESEGKVVGPSPHVIEFFEQHNPNQLKKVASHPSHRAKGKDMEVARAEAWSLIRKFGGKALSFANFDQLSILYAMKPASAPGKDPIAKAVLAYAKRADKVRIGGRGITFPGYETIMQPIVDHLSALYALDHTLKSATIMQTPLGALGKNLYRKLFRTYATLPIAQEATRVRNMLTNLISSDHSSKITKQASGFVGDSFNNLDFRPANQTEEKYVEARERFKRLTIGELFSSLALLHSLVNSVDKHGTSPVLPAERAITLADVQQGMTGKVTVEGSQWESRLRSGVRSRHFRVEADLVGRVASWRG